MYFPDAYFITGNAYAGKSTLVSLLAKKHGGAACEENYHDRLLPELDKEAFEEYEAWFDAVSKECETLEKRILSGLTGRGKPIFVDTNISLETLRTVAAPRHVLVMLAPPEISVRRFFDRPDREKQFLYRLILEEPDPEAAMENYRRGLMRINSRERYDRFLHSGFPVILRDENRTPEETLALAEQVFGLYS